MKVIQLIGGVVILFIFLSCNNNQEIYKNDNPSGSIMMRINVQQRVSDNLLLEIIQLTDKRCPVGSVCDGAGNVEVEFRIYSNNEISTKTVYFSDFQNGSQNTDTIVGHAIELIKITPYPYADKPLDNPEHYTVSLKVEKL
jgi:hypothetical protein